MPNQIANKNGFSLLELSVVLVIIGIIIYMLLAVTTAQLEQGRIKTTQDKLVKIQNALIVFYGINNRLPCPADGTALTSDSSYGKETFSNASSGYNDTNCSGENLKNGGTDALSTVYVGTVPTRSLGLSDDIMTDAWGDRFTYVVSKPCVDPDDWSLANNYKCTSTGATNNDGDSIIMIGQNGATYPWPNPVAYIVISHGKDQLGAYPRMGGSGSKIVISTASSTNLYEFDNANVTPTGNGAGTANPLAYITYYDLPINNGDIFGNYYDDLTIWNTAPQIYYYANH